MTVSSITLNTRFGYGVRPGAPDNDTVASVLSALTVPDPLDKRFARPGMQERIDFYLLVQRARKAERDSNDNTDTMMSEFEKLQRESRKWIGEDMKTVFLRATFSDNGFRERLVAFWADHFTVSGKNPRVMFSIGAYLDEAIRPNITGNFAGILKAVVTHPAMLMFLDQHTSFGPNSKIGLEKGRGLNENLAREILELHTMGVDGSYTQDDVRQFAELLTGLQVNKNGFRFAKQAAEPGESLILGKTYGANKPKLDHIFEFLDDLSVHPETANHLARKLAVHFISEEPSDDLVSTIAAAYNATGGDLMALYEAMLNHPDSASPIREKIKLPIEYMVSTMRALNLGSQLEDADYRELADVLAMPLLSMGQELFRPGGPDGWSESGEYWITAPALAARIEWAAEIAKAYGQETDPRLLLAQVLGDEISFDLVEAVVGAESKWEGVALLLVSPEFNRR